MTSYSLYARNCITCRNATESEPEDAVYIRYQTNAMPKRCYGSDLRIANYPTTQKIDFEVLWNPNVLNVDNVDESTIIDEASTTSLLCDQTFSSSANMISDYSYTETGSFDIDTIVGFTMDNVMISNAVDYASRDALEQMSDYMDFCLAYADELDRFTQHTFSSCYTTEDE